MSLRSLSTTSLALGACALVAACSGPRVTVWGQDPPDYAPNDRFPPASPPALLVWPPPLCGVEDSKYTFAYDPSTLACVPLVFCPFEGDHYLTWNDCRTAHPSPASAADCPAGYRFGRFEVASWPDGWLDLGVCMKPCASDRPCTPLNKCEPVVDANDCSFCLPSWGSALAASDAGATSPSCDAQSACDAGENAACGAAGCAGDAGLDGGTLSEIDGKNQQEADAGLDGG